MKLRIFPTSDQEAIDVVNQIKRIYPEAKKNDANKAVDIEITLDRTCSDDIIQPISEIIDNIKLLDNKDRIHFNRI